MLEEKTTFCRICENQCGLTVSVADNRIIKVRPDAAHVTTRGYACIKGLTLENVRSNPDRVTTPLKRVDDKFIPISWAQALDEIGQKVRALRKLHGDDSVGVYYGNPISFSVLGPVVINGFAQGLNTAKVFNTASLDCNNKFVVSQHMYGSPMALTFPDINHTNFLMLIGSNPAVSKGSFIHLPAPTERLKEIVARGGRVVHLNPRYTETARLVGEHVFIRPDTDIFFLLGFLHEIVARAAISHAHVQDHMKGYAQLAALATPWTPEKQADVSGISAERLRQLVSAYLAADGAALYASTGINQGSNGTLAFWILEAINAITGNLDRRGGTLMGKGIVDFARIAARTQYREFRSRIGNIGSSLGALPMALLADEILSPGDAEHPPIRALFVFSGNPLLSSTDSRKTAKALAALELLVCIDLFRSETAEHAHYILPGIHFSERPDIPFFFLSLCGLMPEPWFQYTDRLVDPPGECRDELWIVAALAAVCAAPLFGSRLLRGLLKLGAAVQRIPGLGRRFKPTHERILELISLFGKQGSLKTLRQFPHGKLLTPNQANTYLGQRVLTSDGKVDLAPRALLEQAEQRLAPSFAHACANLGSSETLLLIGKRERYTHNTWSHNDPAYVKGKRHTNYLYMHPDDAARRGLNEGDLAQVTSAAGTLSVPLCLTTDMMPGTVALPQGWGHQSAIGLSVAAQTTGVNANLLALDGPTMIEPLSGMAQFNGIVVTVSLARSTPLHSAA